VKPTAIPDCARYLVLRHEQTLWAVADTAVRGVVRAEDGSYRVELEYATLQADDVLGIVTGIEAHPPSAAMRRYWGAPMAGLAVHDRRPLILLDPAEPPAVLRCDLSVPEAS
jgi:hypothetical protein